MTLIARKLRGRNGIRRHSMIRNLCIICIALLVTSGCGTLSTASHFTEDSPKFYSGTRLDIHASKKDEDILLAYKKKYGVEPPAYPRIDLPFSVMLDTIILVPIVLPVVLYQAVFD
jgi:uncharacterized protein YceK